MKAPDTNNHLLWILALAGLVTLSVRYGFATAEMVVREYRDFNAFLEASAGVPLERTNNESATLFASMALRSCTVSFTSSSGIRHSVDVTAETLFEAAAIGLALLKKDGWTPPPGGGTRIEVAVREPETKHTLTVMQIERWLMERPAARTSGKEQQAEGDVALEFPP